MDSLDALPSRSTARRATENPEGTGRFGQAMTSMRRKALAGMTAHYDFRAFEYLVDSGGNTGTLLLDLFERTPGLTPASPP